MHWRLLPESLQNVPNTVIDVEYVTSLMGYLYVMLHEGVEGFPTERLCQLLRTYGLVIEL